MTFGINIRKARRAKGMNQIAFADALGVSQSAVSNWERGYDMPGLATLFKIVEMTGDETLFSMEALIGNKPSPIPPPAKGAAGKAETFMDAMLDLFSRIEALEQKIECLLTKDSGARPNPAPRKRRT